MAAEYPTVEARLRAVREAAAHDYPTADIDEILADVERGHLGETPPEATSGR